MTNLTRSFTLGLALLVASSSLAFAGGVDLSGLGGFADPYRTLPSAGGNNGSGNPNFRGGQAGDVDTPASHALHKLACIVGGSPSQLPKGILVGNTGNTMLVAGTKLNFTVPSVGVKGAFLLPKNLPAGTQLEIADLFAGAVAGSPCSVKVAA